MGRFAYACDVVVGQFVHRVQAVTDRRRATTLADHRREHASANPWPPRSRDIARHRVPDVEETSSPPHPLPVSVHAAPAALHQRSAAGPASANRVSSSMRPPCRIATQSETSSFSPPPTRFHLDALAGGQSPLAGHRLSTSSLIATSAAPRSNVPRRGTGRVRCLRPSMPPRSAPRPTR